MHPTSGTLRQWTSGIGTLAAAIHRPLQLMAYTNCTLSTDRLTIRVYGMAVFAWHCRAYVILLVPGLAGRIVSSHVKCQSNLTGHNHSPVCQRSHLLFNDQAFNGEGLLQCRYLSPSPTTRRRKRLSRAKGARKHDKLRARKKGKHPRIRYHLTTAGAISWHADHSTQR